MSDEPRNEVLDRLGEIREEVDGIRSVTLTEDRVNEMIAEAARDTGYRPSGGDVRVTSEPEQYGWRGQRSWFADLVGYKMGASSSAGERLARQSELATRDLSSTDGSGGEFVPPIYMQDEFIELARAGRTFADIVRGAPLPQNTDSINLPRLATGTATGAQSDNAAVQETDASTNNVNVPVRTIAGMQDVSRQLFDRSIPGVDLVLLADLAADYATKLNVQCLNGNGSAPNARGILNVSGIEAVAYTDGTPTVPELHPKGADAVQRVHTLRYMPPQIWVMHPRRWGWMLAALDSTNRPLVSAEAPSNAFARFDRVAPESIVGQWHGLPVAVDPSIPTNLGAGTNEDIILLTRADDQWLFEEGAPNQATYFEVLSGTLGVRLQVYGYFAFTAERYPKATATIGGTGLVTPTF